MKRVAIWLVVVAGCGDNTAAVGSFEIVGHSDLGARGMNAALAVADDTAYVGSRIDGKGVAIVDISDPSAPVVIGELGLPGERVPGMSSRELRTIPDLNLLVVLNLVCSVDLHGCSGATNTENLTFYDITARRAPRLLSVVPVTNPGIRASHSPHEFFLWRDPVDRNRVLVFLTMPGAAPQFEIVDATVPSAPSLIIQWDAVADGGLSPAGGQNNILHSVGASDDGRTAYFSHQLGGLVLVDLSDIIDKIDPPRIRMITPPANALLWPNAAMGPHSATPVPGRAFLLVVTEEVYAPPFGAGCPWGHLRTVDVSDPIHLVVEGEFAVAEQASCSGVAPNVAFTAHNATVTEDLALVSWYAGGLQAIDVSDASNPSQLAELRPEPLAHVDVEDPALGGNPVEMWSYPVIQRGLIYVVDVRNGLYILRYHGRWGEQVSERPFLEGNSNVGADLGRH